jgi:hypothetical protein
MNRFEEAKARARELDKLQPEYSHAVGINYDIVRWRNHKDEKEETYGTTSKED